MRISKNRRRTGGWASAAVAVAVLVTAAACSSTAGDPGPSSPSAVVASSPSPTSVASSWTPEDVAIGSDGSLYVSVCADHAIYRVDPSGELTTFAGVLEYGGIDNGFEGDGGPASEAVISCPIDLLFDGQGDLLFVAHGNNRIRMIDPEGTITTIAGSGPASTNTGSLRGDGGPATRARLNEPVGIALDGDGNLYIADRDNDVVRKVDPDGIITTFAGNGRSGYGGDGGPATEARLDDPENLAIGDDGTVYISDSNNDRVRAVFPDGTIETYAGTGEPGSTGDGGPATEAQLNDPNGLAFDDAGNLYVSESSGLRIRVIDPDGTIETFAGTGGSGSSGDGGPATEATFISPAGITFDDRGDLYVADDGGALRVIHPDGTIQTVTPP